MRCQETPKSRGGMAVPHVGTELEDRSEPEIRQGGCGSERRPLPPGQAACMEDKPWTQHTARTLHPRGPGGTVAKLAAQWLRLHASLQGSWVQSQIRGLSSHLPRGVAKTQNVYALEKYRIEKVLDLITNPVLKPNTQGPHSRTENSQSNTPVLKPNTQEPSLKDRE